MYEKSCLMLVLLSCHASISYENDVSIKAVDSARSIPLNVAFYNPSNVQLNQLQQFAKLFKLDSDEKSPKFKRHSDNVRGDLLPQSRRDILNIKQVSFHGRDRPTAEALIGENPSNDEEQDSEEQSDINQPKASKRNEFFRRPTHKEAHKHKSIEDIEEIPPYVPDNSPFFPIMRPSPINVMPTQPPSFDAIRSYVQYLKARRDKFFTDFEDDDKKAEASEPAAYEGEINYFKQREKELAREEELRNSEYSPANYVKVIDSSDDEEHPYTDNSSTDSNESEAANNDNSDEENAVIHHYDHEDGDRYRSTTHSDSSDETSGDESKKKENFIPFKLYAQVRHVEAESHEKPPRRGGNVREKVSLAKKNIYYKEEGYDDKNYDHEAEKVDYHQRNKNQKRPHHHYHKIRAKRSTEGQVDVSEMPVALALIKKSELSQLTGMQLFNHVDEIIKNSSKYLAEDDDGAVKLIQLRSVQPGKIEYPYYNLPESVLSQMSAQRYSESHKNPPKSIYDYKNIGPCEPIEDNVDPVPKDVEDEPTKYNESPKRLNNLGDKIQCFREKYFGKDPFDNPLFKEDDYVEASIPIPLNHNLSRQANPLITVYDDVIHNIRSVMLNDFKNKREAEEGLKQLASEEVPIQTKKVDIPNYSSVVGVAQLPMFDINNFLPKFKGSISKYSGEVEGEEQELAIKSKSNLIAQKKRKRNNMEGTRKGQLQKKKKRLSQLNTVPETPPKPISSSIKNVQTVMKTNGHSKFRRLISPSIVVIPAKQISTTYRLKLL